MNPNLTLDTLTSEAPSVSALSSSFSFSDSICSHVPFWINEKRKTVALYTISLMGLDYFDFGQGKV